MPKLGWLSSRSLNGIGIKNAVVIPAVTLGMKDYVTGAIVPLISGLAAAPGVPNNTVPSVSFDSTQTSTIQIIKSSFATYPITVEYWCYIPTGAGDATPVSLSRVGSPLQPVFVRFGASNTAYGVYTNSTTSTSRTEGIGAAFPRDTWHHVVMELYSSTNNPTIADKYDVYINGVLRSNFTFTALALAEYQVSASTVLNIGGSPINGITWNHNGYVSEVRVSSGLRYTTTFTPPTTPFTIDSTTLSLIKYGSTGSWDSNTVLLLRFDSTANALVDYSMYNTTNTVTGTPDISTSEFKFGTGSITNSANSTVNASGSFLPGRTEVHTIEFWFKVTSLSSTTFLIRYASTPNFAQLALSVDTNGGMTGAFGNGAGGFSNATLVPASSVSANIWNHFAIVVTQGSTVYSAYLNGVRTVNVTNGVTNYYPESSILLTVFSQNRNGLGYVDEVKVSKGARYSGATYTVPVAPFDVYVPSSTRAFSVAQSTSRGLYTTDGTTWAETTLPASDIWIDTNYNPAADGRACALAWGRAIYSTDYGQTWLTATGMGGADGSVEKLAPVTSTVWITVGTSTTNYYRSTNNGQTWTVLNFGSIYNGSAVAGVGAGLAVIVTNSLTYYTTIDGLTFTTRTFPSNPTGDTNFRRIEHVSGLYIAIQGGPNGRYIMTSPDGTNWTVRDVSGGASYGGQLRDISFGGSLPGTWLIVNDFPTVYFTSTDLVTWTSRTLPTARRWSGIAWVGNQWVAIVDDDTQNIKAVSTDGITWVESSLSTSGARWSDLTEVR